MCRIKRKSISVEADRIVQLLDSVEHALYIGLEPIPELPKSAENGRLILEPADETPNHRVEALLKFTELKLDFGCAEQQSAEHL